VIPQAFVHPQGICESKIVGQGTTIWAFAHVLPGAVIGRNVNVCDHVFIENDVVVGDRVTIKSGVQLWDGIELQDDVFVGPNVTFTNDRFPRSKQYPEAFPRTIVEKGASIGGGSVILPGLRIGRNSMVGAGAVVTRDIPAFAIVVGNPARITGYTDLSGQKLLSENSSPQGASANSVRELHSSSLVPLRKATDMRGSLVVAELGTDLPFVPQRFFIVYDVPSREVRGEHAHFGCEQFLICINGAVRAIVDDGTTREEFVVDSPDVGLYMPAMTWGTQYAYSPDAVLAVFASLPYDDSDYIRTYSEFQAEVARRAESRA
jgi:UDP-2-acetamido-3-amino-2,3-dideoxy-glucuronate N-acetyltransferase